MTLEQIAAFAEIIASLGVIISLVYIARQMKQNTEHLKISNASLRVDREYSLVDPIMRDRDLMELWLKGGDRFSELDEADQMRLILFEHRAIMSWFNLYKQHQEGLVDEGLWNLQLAIIGKFSKREAIHRAWEELGDGYSQDFREYMEDLLGRSK